MKIYNINPATWYQRKLVKIENLKYFRFHSAKSRKKNN